MAKRSHWCTNQRRVWTQTIPTPRLEWAARLDRRGRESGLEQDTASTDSRAISSGQGHTVDTQEGMLEPLQHPSPQADELQADNLQGSGFETVLMTSLYAIVGAVALERGGEVANKVVQEKILAPLGFSFSPES